MSHDKTKKAPPSIDDLINNDLSGDDKNIDLDEFSLDSLNLETLDTMLEKSPKAPTKLTKSSDDDVSVDLEFTNAKPSKLSNSKLDGSSILDELDALSQSQSQDENKVLNLDSVFEEMNDNPLGSLAEPNLPSLTTQQDDLLVSPDLAESRANANDAQAAPLAATVSKPAKKSLFGGGNKKKESKPKTTKTSRPTKTKAGKPTSNENTRLSIIILGAIVALAVVIGAWLLIQDKPASESVSRPVVTESTSDAVMEPTSEQPSEPEPTSAESVAVEESPANVVTPTEPPASVPAPSLPDTSAIDAAVLGSSSNNGLPTPTAPQASDSTSPAPTPSVGEDSQMIDVKSITNADIPEDPALIKEEIDRLNDKGGQLADQAKLIGEQLTLMKDLTKQKEEQIALLEAQIAQLEKEKQGK